MASINKIRADIDKIDDELLRMLNMRAELALKVKATAAGKTPIRPERETNIIRRLNKNNSGPLPAEAVRSIFTQIIGSFRDKMQLNRPIKVSYLGPKGTFSEEAATQLFGDNVELQPEDTISLAVKGVELGASELVVIPIENSTEGSVTETHKLLLETSAKIVAEISLPIIHHLLSNEKKLITIKSVYGHPQALGQCRQWLATHLPAAKLIPSTSNGKAAEEAASRAGSAAIAGKNAGEIYNLKIIQAGINDQPGNETRFIALGKLETKPTGNDKTSIICVMQDKPGALYELLKPLAQQKISMTRLTSQPYKKDQYVFYIDFDGHEHDPNVKASFNQMHKHTIMWEVLGSYAKGVEVA